MPVSRVEQFLRVFLETNDRPFVDNGLRKGTAYRRCDFIDSKKNISFTAGPITCEKKYIPMFLLDVYIVQITL